MGPPRWSSSPPNLPTWSLLDVMMPNIDGLMVCRVLRAERNRVPILMLTARTETSERIAGLDAGADDYLPKPFDLGELLARLRALLRRARPDDEPVGDGLRLADLRIDPAARRVWRGSTEVELSRTEFELLELLVRNQGIVLDHSTIYDRIWGYDFGPDSEEPRRVHQLPAPQARRRVRGQADPYRARRRLHRPRVMISVGSP